MDEKTIQAILKALSQGLRVELIQLEDGSIIVQTVKRRRIKI